MNAVTPYDAPFTVVSINEPWVASLQSLLPASINEPVPPGGGGPPVTPPSLPSLSYCWRYEADDKTKLFQTITATTPVANDGDVVGTWNDSSTAALNTVASANDTTRPLWRSGSGANWVEFDGVNDYMRNSTAAAGFYANGVGGNAVSLALRSSNGTTSAYVMVETNSSNANYVYSLKADGTTASSMTSFIRNSTGGLVVNNIPTLLNAFNGTDKVITFTDTGSAILFFVDDQPAVGIEYARSGTVGVNQFALGAFFRTGTISSWWSGRIYNAMALLRPMTRIEHAQTVAYQAYKQGGRRINKPTPMYGTNSAYFLRGTFIDGGASRLLYEKTQAWSVSCRLKMPTTSLGQTCVIATNVTTSPAFPGIDFLWVNTSGHAHVRLIKDISSNTYMGVQGSTNLCDGNAHTVLVTYDGSGVAAGVQFYVDGVLETKVVEMDALATNSVVSAGGHLYIGNQMNHLDFPVYGELALLRIYSVAKNQAFATQYVNGQAPYDAASNCVLAYNFQAGAGLTETDLSPSGFNGTLSTEMIWYV